MDIPVVILWILSLCSLNEARKLFSVTDAWCQIRTLNLKYHKNKSKSFEFWMFVFPQISIYEYSNYFGGYFGQQLITW